MAFKTSVYNTVKNHRSSLLGNIKVNKRDGILLKVQKPEALLLTYQTKSSKKKKKKKSVQQAPAVFQICIKVRDCLFDFCYKFQSSFFPNRKYEFVPFDY